MAQRLGGNLNKRNYLFIPDHNVTSFVLYSQGPEPSKNFNISNWPIYCKHLAADNYFNYGDDDDDDIKTRTLPLQ